MKAIVFVKKFARFQNCDISHRRAIYKPPNTVGAPLLGPRLETRRESGVDWKTGRIVPRSTAGAALRPALRPNHRPPVGNPASGDGLGVDAAFDFGGHCRRGSPLNRVAVCKSSGTLDDGSWWSQGSFVVSKALL